ncbi:unnamed protein product [Lepidochelys olivacea]
MAKVGGGRHTDTVWPPNPGQSAPAPVVANGQAPLARVRTAVPLALLLIRGQFEDLPEGHALCRLDAPSAAVPAPADLRRVGLEHSLTAGRAEMPAGTEPLGNWEPGHLGSVPSSTTDSLCGPG